MSSLPIVMLCVLSLLQGTRAEPRPEFALAGSVPGTTRVTLAAAGAATAISEINVSVQGYTIESELELLSSVATIVATIANDFQPLADTLITAVTTLAGDASGDIVGLFGAAVGATNEAIGYADETLPGLRDQLVLLVGTDLPDKFIDSFQHIGKGLQAILASLGDLQEGATAALAEAGSTALTADIIRRNMRRPLLTDLANALYLLKSTVPVLEYTISSTMENIGLADAFMLELDEKVDDTIGESGTLVQELDPTITAMLDTYTNTIGTLGASLTQINSDFLGLTNLATATSAAQLSFVLADFNGNLEELSQADPSVEDILDRLKEAITDAYDIVDPLYLIYESPMVDALITTLVGNGNYAQYCFYKYKEFFFNLLDSVAHAASQCIAEEVERLEYYRETVLLMIEIVFFDFADIGDNLAICESINNAENLQECTAQFVDIYTALEGAFGDKVTIGLTSFQHEIAAASNRLKICIRLSQSELSDSIVPTLIKKINDCDALGPAAEED